MSSYKAPSSKYNGLYNPDYFIGRDDEKIISATQGETISGDYVKKDGSSIMTGNLMTPSITLFNDGTIQFSDDTIQN